MNSVSNNGRKLRGKSLIHAHYNNFISSFNINLNGDWAWISLTKSRNSLIQFRDMALGPFNL